MACRVAKVGLILQGIIRGRVDASTAINCDGWRGYNGLVDLGYGHFRVDHSRYQFSKGTVNINGIEGFRGRAKVRLAKFKDRPGHTLHLHLKETEWRQNHRPADKYQTLQSNGRKPKCSQIRPARRRRDDTPRFLLLSRTERQGDYIRALTPRP